MKIYFKSSNGSMREIADVKTPDTKQEFCDITSSIMQEFCDKRGFTIYYTRIWEEPVNGVMMTAFDIGSHTEFFYADVPISRYK